MLTKVNLQLIFVVCPKKWQKMQFLAKNQVKLIFEVEHPFNHSGNPFKRYFGQDTPSKHVLWYIIPLSHSYVYLAWAPGPLWGRWLVLGFHFSSGLHSL